MLPVTNGAFEPLQSSAVRWGNKLTQAAAVCNGLTMINKSTIVGDGAERRLFQTVEARFLVRFCSLKRSLRNSSCRSGGSGQDIRAADLGGVPLACVCVCPHMPEACCTSCVR
jgi:hypothetical protein